MIDPTLFDAVGLDALLPAALAPWRPLVAEGLLYFLQRLPAKRLESILAGQLALASEASPAQRLVALLSACPTLHKLGQVVARHRNLDPELRRHLQALESMPAITPMRPLLARIRREIGTAPGIQIAPSPLAEGSVAVVVPFTYDADGERRHGVFKILKPGVEAKLAEELAVFADLAAFLAEHGRQMGLPALDYRDTLDSVQRLLQREIHFETEQTNLAAAAAFYADEPRLRVPQLLPWCTPRLTAMERIFGGKAADAALPAGERRQLADTLVATLLAKPFWTRAEPAVFHADLHAGNLLLDTDGRLVAIDWSLTARLTGAQRQALVAIALGGLTFDHQRICRSAAQLGGTPADAPALAAIVERALDRLVQQGRLPGFDWLVTLLDDLALAGLAAFSEDFALFRKSWLSLAGAIGDLAGQHSPDAPLLAAGLRQLAAELPSRLLALPHSPDFGTHVSNADLLQLGTDAWLAPWRYWSRLANWNTGIAS